MTVSGDPLLSVSDLHTRFDTPDGTVHAVNGVSFTIDEGEVVGIVGESGSGKSVTGLSVMRLESPGRIASGSVRFRDTDLTAADPATVRTVRGTDIGMVFQDPTRTLNPTFTVTEQIAESLKLHEAPDDQRLLEFLHVPPFSDRAEWRGHRERALALMADVGIPRPAERVDAYPHEFSGGMRQRATLAIALARDPDLLIADEPTTALDVTIQAQILDRLQRLSEDRGMAVLLITHDLGVVAELCDRVIVMYGGQIMETGPIDRILEAPAHPYTRALLDCLPQTMPAGRRLRTIDGRVPDLLTDPDGCPFAERCGYATDECREDPVSTVEVAPDQHAACCRLDAVAADDPVSPRSAPAGPPPGPDPDAAAVLEVRNVTKRFAIDESLVDRLLGTQRDLEAVSDVSLSVRPGETLGIVGESGSGKSTLAGVIAGLYAPTSGEVLIDGDRVGAATDRDGSVLRDVGMVFQNPKASLDPRMAVVDLVAEPLRADDWDAPRRRRRVRELLDIVGLPESHLGRYPHELSGGQAQRVAIARAIALTPRVLILDEPVSALDVSVQAKILNLLVDLQADLGLTCVFIAHDLSVVEHVADRIAVMYLGRLMEVAPTDRLFESPANPYTAALLSAVPTVDSTGRSDDRIILEGEVPSPVTPPDGCAFHPRCPHAEPKCEETPPPVQAVDGATSRCHFAEDFGG